MATEATYTVPADGFPLGSVFRELPTVRVELERVIPTGGALVPYCWVQGMPLDDAKNVFDKHPAINGVESIDSVDDEYLFRIEWDREHEGLLNTLLESGLTLMKAVGTSDEWTFEVRGDDRTDLAIFQRQCREYDIPITLTKLHALTPLESATESVLTDAQEEALVLAYDRGYFDLPRKVTMEDIGAELGISQQAVASRLRRGISHILEQTLSATES